MLRTWTDDRTADLCRLFAAGAADEEIARTLGVSRRAVIGKRQRLNLFRVPPNQSDAYTMAIRRAAKRCSLKTEA